MRLVIGLLVVTSAACGGDDGGYNVGGNQDGSVPFPDTGGGGGDGGGSGSDGSVGLDGAVTPIDAGAIDGRVCLLTDARILNQCANTGAGGLTVRLGAATALTADDGSFTIESQSGAGLVWRITGPNIVSSFEVLADYFIPAMSRTMYDQLKADNGVMIFPGEGSIFLFASRDAQGVVGATSEADPLGFYRPFYDDDAGVNAYQHAQPPTGTESNGAIWIPGIDVGNVTVTTTIGNIEVATTAPIFDGGITFANVLFP